MNLQMTIAATRMGALSVGERLGKKKRASRSKSWEITKMDCQRMK